MDQTKKCYFQKQRTGFVNTTKKSTEIKTIKQVLDIISFFHYHSFIHNINSEFYCRPYNHTQPKTNKKAQEIENNNYLFMLIYISLCFIAEPCRILKQNWYFLFSQILNGLTRENGLTLALGLRWMFSNIKWFLLKVLLLLF